MLNLPKHVTILSHEFTILRLNDDDSRLEGNLGKVDFGLQEIYLSKKQSHMAMRETLQHEVFHIIDYYTAGAENQLKERDIHRISQVYFDTAEKNPKYIRGIYNLDTD